MCNNLIPSSTPGKSINFIGYVSTLEGTNNFNFLMLSSETNPLQWSLSKLGFLNSFVSFNCDYLLTVLNVSSLILSLLWNFTDHLVAVARSSFEIKTGKPISLLRRVVLPAFVTPITTYF